MRSIDRFLEHAAANLLRSAAACDIQAPPVDLRQVARAGRVLSIEEREMVPEAVLAPEATGFRIYLQSNFADGPGARVRQRFSLAHEIAHTFFYEVREGALKPMRKGPKGLTLESACHKGAGMLLVPRQSITRDLAHIGRPLGAGAIINLSRRYDVSPETMLRRLAGIGAFESDELALVLVTSARERRATIDFAVYPPWLKAVLPIPERGTSFDAWIRRCEPEDSLVPALGAPCGAGLRRRTSLGTLLASPFAITRHQRIFELRIES